MSPRTAQSNAATLTQPEPATFEQIAVRYPDGEIQFCHDIINGLGVLDSLIASGTTDTVVLPKTQVTTTARKQAEMLVARFGGEVLVRTVTVGDFSPAF